MALAVGVVALPMYAFCAFVSFSLNPSDWHWAIRALFAVIAGTWGLAVILGNSGEQ
jgi:hypothetical protein